MKAFTNAVCLGMIGFDFAVIPILHGQIKRKYLGNPLYFGTDLICDYCARLGMWLAQYEGFDDGQTSAGAWFQIH